MPALFSTAEPNPGAFNPLVRLVWASLMHSEGIVINVNVCTHAAQQMQKLYFVLFFS